MNQFANLFRSLDDRQKLATLQHELRIPLTSIHGYALLIKIKTSKNKSIESEVIYDDINMLIENVDNLIKLLDALTKTLNEESF